MRPMLVNMGTMPKISRAQAALRPPVRLSFALIGLQRARARLADPV